jgi:hypothetical protein
MDPIETLVHVVLAALAACVIAFVGGPLGDRFGREGVRSFGPTIGLALGTALAWNFLVQEGTPAWPVRAAWHTILLVAGALAGLALATTLVPLRTTLERALLVGVGAAAIVGFLLRTPVLEVATTSIKTQHVAFLALLAVAPAAARIAGGVGGLSIPFGWSFCFAAMAGLCIEGSLAKIGIVAGGVGAALGAVSFVAWWTKRSLGYAGGAVVAALLAALASLGAAYYEGQFPLWIWAIPVLAPLASLAARLPFLAERPRAATLVQALAPAVLALAAVGLAVAAGPTPAEDDAAPSPYGYGS